MAAKAKASKQTVKTNEETSKTFKIRPVEFLTENHKVLINRIGLCYFSSAFIFYVYAFITKQHIYFR